MTDRNARTPDAFDAACAELAELLTHSDTDCGTPRCPRHACGSFDCRGRRVPFCIRCAYRWSYNSAFEKTDTGVGSRTSAQGTGDPTGAVAVELGREDRDDRAGRKEYLRRALANATSDINQARGIHERLRKALERSDGHHGPVQKYAPHTSELSDDELAALREAKRRREERGAGFGIG